MTLPLSLPTSSSASQNPDIITGNNNSDQIATESIKKQLAKPHVKTACVNCKRAHLACDLTRPCKRCISSDKADSCHDVEHKKRGRPKLRGMKPMHSHLPSTFTTIYSAPSSSNRAQHDNNTSNYQKPTMTIFLSMELCCARVSDESLDFLGLYPQEFSHRSLYDFILPQHSGMVSRIHRSLLDNAVTFYTGDETDNNINHQQQRKRTRLLPATQRTTADMFITLPPYQLSTIANGSLTLKNTISFITSDKSRYQPLDAQFYLGGGNGADLIQPESLQHLYIVCILTRPDSSNVPLALPPEQQQQQPLPNNASFERDSGADEPICTTRNIVGLATTSAYPEFQCMDFTRDHVQLLPVKSESVAILDFGQDDDRQRLPLKRPAADDNASSTGVMDSTSPRIQPYATPSPPFSPTSSFTVVLALSSPPYQNDSSSNVTQSSLDMDTHQSESTSFSTTAAETSTKEPVKASKPQPASSSNHSSYSLQHHRQRVTYQQPHQLYYQTMLSSRLSGEAQAYASSRTMLTTPTMSAPTYTTAKSRLYQSLPQRSTSNTQYHPILRSSSLSSSTSSSSSLSPSSSSLCHASPTPIATSSSNTTSTSLYTLPSASTQMSNYYD